MLLDNKEFLFRKHVIYYNRSVVYKFVRDNVLGYKSVYVENDNVVMEYLDLIINMVFMGEMVMKVITYGLVLDETAYLKDNWNQLDFVIVLFSLLDLSLTDYNLSFIKVPLHYADHQAPQDTQAPQVHLPQSQYETTRYFPV